MIKGQQQFVVSAYQGLYDIIIPKDNFLRKLNDLVDFSFIYNELLENYSIEMGRGAKDPIMLFKYLILKATYELSDEDVVSRTLYDMSFKYFLNLAPEEVNLIHPSTLTKFRKLHLKDMNLLDLLIKKTVEIAIAKGVLISKTLIVDATHTKARYNQKSAQEVLLERAKSLRKEIYTINSEMKEKFPQKITSDKLEEIIEYCKDLVNVVESTPELAVYEKVKQRLNYLNEAIEDDLEHLTLSTDEDARIHKTEDSSFFGYKTHTAMSEERIITGAVITTGEKTDGKELQSLIEKSQEAGIIVDDIIGDTAYSEKGNLEYVKENEITLISKLNPMVSCGSRKKEDEFQFNKDAGMFVCPAGHMAIRKARQGKKGQSKNQVTTYYFDVKKCKYCSQRDGCYKEGSKSKTYSVSIKSDIHKEQMAFQETEYFKQRARERYMIEAKNSELKHQHGYDVAVSSGLIGMQMQGALTIFTVNIKRIIKLLTEQ
ncbi:IS1182 family transposase [Clostridium magnum]|uniref:Transposase DDE domain protein n=1 Tax=Clostridium magnum DSM 2767 TaxID=1121326 RepID=A0A162T9V2_9CLOT|nr:IS1182 family transposase [Clostridium magnum]KZL92393.1 transposase DDE domain protein [Clostridium magnum DSM 2767]SHH10983.1 Transposase domain [Clostridium magnum DSM 2767]